jgi:hypothetical protein
MLAGVSVAAVDTDRLIGNPWDKWTGWPSAGAEVDGRCAGFGDGGLLKSGQPVRRLNGGCLESIRRVLLTKKANGDRSCFEVDDCPQTGGLAAVNRPKSGRIFAVSDRL